MKLKFNWGTGIVIALLIMMGAMTYLVSIAVRQDHDLVDKNYYQKSMNYQQHIDETANTGKLTEKPVFQITNDTLSVKFPDLAEYSGISGEIHFYSPVSARNDLKVPVKPEQNFVQHIALNKLDKGRYIVKMSWTANATSYFQEEEIRIE